MISQHLYAPYRQFGMIFKIIVAPILIMLNCLSLGYAQTTEGALPDFVAEKFTGDFGEMQERRLIRILVPRSKTDYEIVAGVPRGLQADLITEYEKQLDEGRKRGEPPVKIVRLPVRFDQLIPALIAGKGDIAAGDLTLTPEREELVDFISPKGRPVDELVVTSKDFKALNSIEDLAGQRVYVLASSSYVTHLRVLNQRFSGAGLAEIEIIEADSNLASEDILELVNAGVVQVTVIDDYRGKLWAQVLPNIVVHDQIKVHEGGWVGWAIRKNSPELMEELTQFGQKVKRGSLLGNILFKRHYESTKWITNPIADSERQKLARLVSLFQTYGNQYGFDYLALAAQAYQESGLDHSAKSAAGAIGIMQLLPSTAKDPNVGIEDISILENNIHAGAKYMAFLRERYFSEKALSEENRFAFTWAAYNAGPARVRQLREKAREQGLDPNQWFHNVEHVALERVGIEPVRYVSNIYKYYIAYRLLTDLNQEGS